MKMRVALVLVLLSVAVGVTGAQTINIDLGLPGTAPPTGYRAAGMPGFWNAFEATEPTITYPLFDNHGQPTGATARQYGGTEILSLSLGGPGEPEGADALLLGDTLLTHTTIETCLFFHGLQNGTWEVTSYAWHPGKPSTQSSVHIDFNPTTVLVGGSWSGSLSDPGSYTRHLVPVTTGFLGPHSGVPAGGDFGIGASLSGIQLRRVVEEPPLFLDDRSTLAWLTALDAQDHDVVRGDLVALRATGGDFTAAVTDCLADDTTSMSLHEAGLPAPGQGWFYLVRGSQVGGAMTWNSPGPGQVGDRDSEIDASAGNCS
jgi:hypothetical protein